MKIRPLLLLTLTLLLTGCISPRSAQSRLTIKASNGLEVVLELPKDLRADKLRITAGDYTLDAVNLHTSASAPIKATTEQNVKALETVQDVAKTAALLAVP